MERRIGGTNPAVIAKQLRELPRSDVYALQEVLAGTLAATVMRYAKRTVSRFATSPAGRETATG
ncbi:MAG: hypothetical protein ACR2NU_02050 [Aeoliella sp.]